MTFNPDTARVEIDEARSDDPRTEGMWAVRIVYHDDEGRPIHTVWMSPDEAREQARFLLASFSQHFPGKLRARKLAQRLNDAADTVEILRVEDRQ